MRQRTRYNQTLMKLLLSSATITIATLLLLCIVSVSAQEFDDIQNVINEVMEVYCFTPCSDGFTGHEVIPGTKCQWYHSCAGGLPQNIIQCGDGKKWYNINAWLLLMITYVFFTFRPSCIHSSLHPLIFLERFVFPSHIALLQCIQSMATVAWWMLSGAQLSHARSDASTYFTNNSYASVACWAFRYVVYYALYFFCTLHPNTDDTIHLNEWLNPSNYLQKFQSLILSLQNQIILQQVCDISSMRVYAIQVSIFLLDE